MTDHNCTVFIYILLMDSQTQWGQPSRVEKEKEARKRHETWDTVIVSSYIIGEMAKPKPAFIQLSIKTRKSSCQDSRFVASTTDRLQRPPSLAGTQVWTSVTPAGNLGR
ncbi:hypothetical protein BKA67DRAFT_322695 [Truncatella angustata]|uniref:Uncharacterized protein n=1 Tax=Truncatella angustata TaxID=152316 RepID=A0A9P8ZWB1_9PEZI|nr:uncharacterized protein BKA67DRAFT_322695 [Truncatella angustata]KAH6653490.1 hypothetical protein BKA67DRAFT_322695 [Truncatella angustata]